MLRVDRLIASHLSLASIASQWYPAALCAGPVPLCLHLTGEECCEVCSPLLSSPASGPPLLWSLVSLHPGTSFFLELLRVLC